MILENDTKNNDYCDNVFILNVKQKQPIDYID